MRCSCLSVPVLVSFGAEPALLPALPHALRAGLLRLSARSLTPSSASGAWERVGRAPGAWHTLPSVPLHTTCLFKTLTWCFLCFSRWQVGEAIRNFGNQGTELGRASEQPAWSFRESGFCYRGFHQAAVPVWRGHVQRLLRPGRRCLCPQTRVTRRASALSTAQGRSWDCRAKDHVGI